MSKQNVTLHLKLCGHECLATHSHCCVCVNATYTCEKCLVRIMENAKHDKFRRT